MTTTKQAKLVEQLRQQSIENGKLAHEMHLGGKSWREVGETFGVSRQRAQQMQQQYLRSLKQK